MRCSPVAGSFPAKSRCTASSEAITPRVTFSANDPTHHPGDLVEPVVLLADPQRCDSQRQADSSPGQWHLRIVDAAVLEIEIRLGRVYGGLVWLKGSAAMKWSMVGSGMRWWGALVEAEMCQWKRHRASAMSCGQGSIDAVSSKDGPLMAPRIPHSEPISSSDDHGVTIRPSRGSVSRAHDCRSFALDSAPKMQVSTARIGEELRVSCSANRASGARGARLPQGQVPQIGTAVARPTGVTDGTRTRDLRDHNPTL